MHAYPRASGPLVCIVDDNDNSRWPADAALIAAAPDLLAFAELVAETFGSSSPIADDARAAIAKAKGGAK